MTRNEPGIEIKSPPCKQACPILTDVREYVQLIAERRFEEAFATIRSQNPLPRTCGRICTHPCEAACKRGQVEQHSFDLVVLATACVPSEGSDNLATMLGFNLDESGFVKTDPNKPVDTSLKGIFVCSWAQGPMDIPSSVSPAIAAAAASAAVQTVKALG